jgi:hypothetical protein
VTLALGVAAIGDGCGSTANGGSQSSATSSPAGLRAQRADLLTVSRGLAQLEGPVAHELASAKLAWPSLAHGLPATVTPALRSTIATASVQAKLIPTQPFMAHAGQLTGPAAGIAGLLGSFENLLQPCWQQVQASAGAGTGSVATVRFLRANAGLYIGCVYDAHYNLRTIGARVHEAYAQLGGARAFGSALSASEVAQLTQFYSPIAARLTPKPPH